MSERSFRLRIPPPTPHDGPWRDRDWTRPAAWWMRGVGGLQLVGFDLGGLVLLILAGHVERRGPRARRWAIGIHGLYLAGIVVVAFLLAGGAPLTPRFLGSPFDAGKLVVLLILAAAAPIHLAPLLMLLAPGTRRAFALANFPTRCARCGYDLRRSDDRCPECGRPIPPRQRDELEKRRRAEAALQSFADAGAL